MSSALPEKLTEPGRSLFERGAIRVKKMKTKTITALLAVLIFSLTLAGCGGQKALYYKPGGNQAAFDRDARICLESAKDITRSRMLNPEGGLDPGILQKSYEECLYARGWSDIPLNQRDRSLWWWKGRRVKFGEFPLDLPEGFRILSHSRWVYGPGWSHQLFIQGPDNQTYLVMVAQENLFRKFEVIDYPAPAGYTRYTGGMLDRHDARWSVFTGRYGDKTVAILGAYIYLDKKRRISLVFSKYLNAGGLALPGFTLSLNQKEELETLYGGWLSWIKDQADAEEGERESFIRRYFRILPRP